MGGGVGGEREAVCGNGGGGWRIGFNVFCSWIVTSDRED